MDSRRALTITCLDSSALLRLCFEEGDFSLVEQAMSALPSVSVLAAVEVPCAIHARFHRRALGVVDRNRFLANAAALLQATSEIALTPAIRQEAVNVTSRMLVRTLDALHLATAVVLTRQQRRRGNVVRFCTADLRQAEAAVALLGRAQVDIVPPSTPTP